VLTALCKHRALSENVGVTFSVDPSGFKARTTQKFEHSCAANFSRGHAMAAVNCIDDDVAIA
jgi:hypothetical protein